MQRLEVSCVVRRIYTSLGARGLKKNLETIKENHAVDSVQKTAVLGTSHTVQNVLQSET